MDDNRPHGTMNLHPDMPRPNVPQDSADPHKWQGLSKLDYYSTKIMGYRVSKADWDAIFNARKDT